jgi:curli biogenesis system outer membrane secretion channel CsgG
MLSKTLLIMAFVCAAILVGCNKTDDNTNMGNTNKAPSMSTPATTAPVSTGDKIGVPECDEYIAKYEACAGKVPEAGRAAYKSGLEQTRSAWKKLAANPATKGSLAAACKQAAEAQAAAWKTYGCTN